MMSKQKVGNLEDLWYDDALRHRFDTAREREKEIIEIARAS